MNGQGHVVATGRLVRPAYRTPEVTEEPGYLETIEDQLALARDENQRLKKRLIGLQAEMKTRLIALQAELDSAVALADDLGHTVQLLTRKLDERRAVKLASQVKKPSSRTSRRWVAGYVRLGDRFPVDLAERTGIAAYIQRPLALRSGAVLYPVEKSVARGGMSVMFPDSSWLILSVLAEHTGAYVSQRELLERVFPGRTTSGIRSAILRARLTLACVNAQQDLETARNRTGWRLLLAEAR